MPFSDETEGLIEAANETREAAVQARQSAMDDAAAAAVAKSKSDESNKARDQAIADANAAKTAALSAIDKELSLPPYQPPAPVAAPAAARRR